MHPAADLLIVHAWVVGLDDRPRVAFGLQESGDEFGFVRDELGGGFFQADVDVEAFGETSP